MTPLEPPAQQPRNPLHGLTLQALLEALVSAYGWRGLGERIPVRCFTHEPSLNSSLKFLRKTPWAREKVESLYRYMLRDTRRQQLGKGASNDAGDNAGDRAADGAVTTAGES